MPATRLAACAIAAAFALSPRAHADDLVWLGAPAGAWTDAALWQPARAPTILDRAIFDHPSASRIFGPAAALSIDARAGRTTLVGDLTLGTGSPSPQAAPRLDIAGGATLSHRAGAASLSGAAAQVAPGAALRLADASAWNATDTVLDIHGRLGLSGAALIAPGRSPMTIHSTGVLRTRDATLSPASLDIHGRARIDGATTAASGNDTLRVHPGATVTVAGGALRGDMGIAASGASIRVGPFGRLDAAGAGIALDRSRLTVHSGGSLGELPRIDLTNGSLLRAESIDAPVTLALRGSTLRLGAIGDAPAGSLATAFALGGHYAQDSASTLDLALGGTRAGIDHATILDADVLDLAGTLRVTLVDGFVPRGGDEFELFRASDVGYGPQWTVNGGFDSLIAPRLGGHAEWSLRTGSDAITLAVVPAPGSAVLGLAAGLGARRPRRR